VQCSYAQFRAAAASGVVRIYRAAVRGYPGLFYGYRAFFCGYTGLLCGYLGLVCGYTRQVSGHPVLSRLSTRCNPCMQPPHQPLYHFAYKRDDILQERPMILRSLLIVILVCSLPTRHFLYFFVPTRHFIHFPTSPPDIFYIFFVILAHAASPPYTSYFFCSPQGIYIYIYAYVEAVRPVIMSLTAGCVYIYIYMYTCMCICMLHHRVASYESFTATHRMPCLCRMRCLCTSFPANKPGRAVVRCFSPGYSRAP